MQKKRHAGPGGHFRLLHHIRKDQELHCTDKCSRLSVFFGDCPCQFAALTAVGSDTQLFPQFGEGTGTLATDVANLMVSNFTANADVH